jgi:beta-galactosidase/beta-glucuronidase
MKFEHIPLPDCPRPGYPRPDFRRPLWQNLNGTWEFEEDPGRSGLARGLHKASSLKDTITVPFCRESKLSGLSHTDFCEQVWYRKQISIPTAWREDGRRVIFHVGACDYRAEVFINGQSVGTHIGGLNAFSFDITDALVEGETQVVTITAIDMTRSGTQCCGKQSTHFESFGCFYTRTTGIWQTVWMESVPTAYIRSTRLFPCAADGKLTLQARVVGGDGLIFRAEAFYEDHAVGAAAAVVTGNHVCLEIQLDEKHLWEIGNGRLYDLTLTLQGEDPDVVDSYFGLRDLAWHDGTLYLNGNPVFQRLVLDQGFYPDGIWTAPTDEELRADIDRSIAMGFQGARLHQKVFEPRFLYECDKAGYIVWGEHGNWGMDISAPTTYQAILPDWI